MKRNVLKAQRVSVFGRRVNDDQRAVFLSRGNNTPGAHVFLWLRRFTARWFGRVR
jgi:hypothetical protein